MFFQISSESIAYVHLIPLDINPIINQWAKCFEMFLVLKKPELEKKYRVDYRTKSFGKAWSCISRMYICTFMQVKGKPLTKF